MHNADALEQAIRDRHFRYRHEAYRARLASHPVRDWLSDRLITLGEAMRSTSPETAAWPVLDQPGPHPG
jgi:hypothetical protein